MPSNPKYRRKTGARDWSLSNLEMIPGSSTYQPPINVPQFSIPAGFDPMYGAMSAYNNWSDMGNSWFSPYEPPAVAPAPARYQVGGRLPVPRVGGRQQQNNSGTTPAVNRPYTNPVVNTPTTPAAQTNPYANRSFNVGGGQPVTAPSTENRYAVFQNSNNPTEARTATTGIATTDTTVGTTGRRITVPAVTTTVTPRTPVGPITLDPRGLAGLNDSGTNLEMAPMFDSDGNVLSGQGLKGKQNLGAGNVPEEGIVEALLGLAGSTNPYISALSALPGIAQTLRGVFGSNDTPEATKVDRGALNRMPTQFNINPQLAASQRSFNTFNENVGRSTAGGSAVANYRAGLSDKLYADNSLYGEKFNRENKMQADIANMQMNYDMTDAQYRNQARTERAMVDAQLGPGGNMAMAGYQSLANAGVQGFRDKKAAHMQALTALIGSKAVEGQSGAIDYLNQAYSNYSNLLNFGG